MLLLLMFKETGVGVDVAVPLVVFRTNQETGGLTATPNGTEPLVEVTSSVCDEGAADVPN